MNSHANEAISAAVRSTGQELVDLSRRIHAHPELAFEEFQASAWVADALHGLGYEVQHGCYDLPTAVHAVIGSGPVHVAICAEYDALPDMGHACGHNIIAAAAVGAAAGLAQQVDDAGLTVTVLGTPAEEYGGGKILMLERGAFDGLDAAMMVHPAPVESAHLAGLATTQFEAVFRGAAAHAGASPELGINAADAMTIAQVAIGLLRQQTRESDRIQGIVTEAGAAPNVIPDFSRGQWIVRGEDLDTVANLRERVQRCFEAAALATGCELSMQPINRGYADLRSDPRLLELWRTHAQALGRDVRSSGSGGVKGMATDMGNVSHVVPTLHPMLGLNCAPATNHQPAFAAACISPAADRAVIDGAIAMAQTVVAFATERTRGA